MSLSFTVPFTNIELTRNQAIGAAAVAGYTAYNMAYSAAPAWFSAIAVPTVAAGITYAANSTGLTSWVKDQFKGAAADVAADVAVRANARVSRSADNDLEQRGRSLTTSYEAKRSKSRTRQEAAPSAARSKTPTRKAGRSPARRGY